MEKFIIDVSTHQKEINWVVIKSQGVEGAILRVGYTGWGSLESYIDAYFERNYKGVTQVNLPVGVYFYSVAITEQEAIDEAKFTLELLKGRKLDMPIFFDTEEQNRKPYNQSNIGKTKLTSVTKAYCDYILNNSDYKVGVYASKSWFETKLNYDDLAHYVIWVAQYNDVCTFKKPYDIWQFSSQYYLAGVSGHSGMVDANWLYETENGDDDMPLKLVVRKQTLVLRKELTFIKRSVKDLCPFTNAYHKTTRYVASGVILKGSDGKNKIFNVGDSLEITELIPGLQLDKWQWVKVLYNGVEYYAQYDSMAYSIEKL